MKWKEKCQRIMAVIEDIEFDERCRLDMNLWGQTDTKFEDATDWDNGVSDAVAKREWDRPSCDTVACLAGWSSITPYVRKHIPDRFCTSMDVRNPRTRKVVTQKVVTPSNLSRWLAFETPGVDRGMVFNAIFDIGLQRSTKALTLNNLKDELTKLFHNGGGTGKLVGWTGWE
jgi:hypothetical protein